MTHDPHKFLTETIPAVALSTAVLAPLTELSVKQQFEAWVALDTIEKTVKKRKEALRDALLAHATANGATTDKGHLAVDFDGSLVIREKRVGKLPELEKLEKLCNDQKKKIPAEKLPWDIVETRVINPSKLESLVELGKLKAEEVTALCNVQFALQVELSDDLQALIKELKTGTAIDVEEVVAPAPQAQAQAG